MKKIIAFCSAILLLQGCIFVPPTQSSAQTTAYLNQNYGLVTVNRFIYNYGEPTYLVDLSDGNKMFIWNVGGTPGLPADTYNYCAPHESYKTNTYPDVPVPKQCDVRICTDSQGIVQRFVLVTDTMGEHSPSRCSEAFAP